MSAARRSPVSKLGMAKKKASPAEEVKSALDFTALVGAVRRVHDECAAAVNRTVNTTLTLRNWVIGAYSHHYQLHGTDRAAYGEKLLERLAERLGALRVPSCEQRRLYAYRHFFTVYPQLAEMVSPVLSSGPEILRSLTAESPPPRKMGRSAKVEAASPQFETPANRLLGALSYTHLEQLVALDDPLKRAFYEMECIRGHWSVRALKRQIATLYFERSALSTDKTKLSKMAHAAAEKAEPKLSIRDPYVFEFLGLRAKDAVSESDLEGALLDNLHEFLMELGHGFCLEARQKSIVIGKTRGFVDLVFYHSILKCHVLIELKVDKLTHEHLGQLNTYVTWYRRHMMTEGDNPPVGLLLCTQRDQVLVEYATANIDNRLFVSKYQLELPKKEELERFLRAKRDELTEGS